MPRARHAAHNLTPEQQTLKYEGVPQLLPPAAAQGLTGGIVGFGSEGLLSYISHCPGTLIVIMGWKVPKP